MSAPRTDYFTLATVLARDAAKQAESEWLAERIKHFNHWPHIRGEYQCADGFCGADDCTRCHSSAARLAEKPTDNEGCI